MEAQGTSKNMGRTEIGNQNIIPGFLFCLRVCVCLKLFIEMLLYEGEKSTKVSSSPPALLLISSTTPKIQSFLKNNKN